MQACVQRAGARFDAQKSLTHSCKKLQNYRSFFSHQERAFVCGLRPCLWAHMHVCVCLQRKQTGSVSVYSSCWVELRSLQKMLWLASPFLCFINCLSGSLLLEQGQRSHFRCRLGSRKKRFVWEKWMFSNYVSVLYAIMFSSTLFVSLLQMPSNMLDRGSISLSATSFTPVLHLTVHVAALDELSLNYYIPVFQWLGKHDCTHMLCGLSWNKKEKKSWITD